jgi:hypothetical protein
MAEEREDRCEKHGKYRGIQQMRGMAGEEDLAVSLTRRQGLGQGDVDTAIVLHFEMVIQSENGDDSEEQ